MEGRAVSESERPRLQRVQLDDQRQLETIVLTQVRDSLALINNNLTKLDDNVRSINDKVVGLLASRYDEQIDELKRQRELDAAAVIKTKDTNDARFIEHDRQLVRLGLGMAIATTVAASAMTGVVALAVARIFGAH